MNQLTGDSKYIDILERSLYNGALAGISLQGDRFFYVNPLASHGDHHRKEWYGTTCCPSQISRFLPSIGNYIYGQSKDAVWVNLYIGNTVEINVKEEKFTLHQETNYPWDGKAKPTVDSLHRPMNKEFHLRIPDWCKNYSITINDTLVKNISVEKGYAVIDREWKSGDEIAIMMDMPIEIVQSDPRVKENIDKRAIQRGPLVYCIEEVDNPSFDELALSSKTQYDLKFIPSLLNEVTTIKGVADNKSITFIPYYAWDNREAGQMKVWIDYKE